MKWEDFVRLTGDEIIENILGATNQSKGLVLADLNNDGRLDVLLSDCCSTVVDKRDDFLPFLPWVWINTSDETGSLKGDAYYLNSLGDLPMRPAVGDLDGDGDLDVYVASLPPKRGNYDPSDRILLNDGSGAFLDSGQRLDNPRKAGAAGSGAVALGDLDGDGDLDAFVGGKTQATIWWNDGMGVYDQSAVRFAYKEKGNRPVPPAIWSGWRKWSRKSATGCCCGSF